MQKHVNLVDLVKSFLSFFFIGRSDLTRKLEKVGPFECDELEKHFRVRVIFKKIGWGKRMGWLVV